MIEDDIRNVKEDKCAKRLCNRFNQVKSNQCSMFMLNNLNQVSNSALIIKQSLYEAMRLLNHSLASSQYRLCSCWHWLLLYVLGWFRLCESWREMFSVASILLTI